MYFVEGVFIYLILIFTIALYSKVTKHSEQHNVCMFAFIVLSLFAGLSYDIGWDYLAYRDAIVYGDIERFEYFERVLMQWSQNMPQLFFLVNHTLIVGLTMWTINRYSSDKFLSILVFICFPFQFLFGLSTIRAAVVVSMIFFGYNYFLKERNQPIWFIAVVALGFFVHKASPIGLLFLLIHYLKIGRLGNLVILLLSFFTTFINIDLTGLAFLDEVGAFEGISDQLDYYADSDYGGGTMIHYCFFALSLIGILFYKRIANNKNATIYLTMITVGYFISMLFQGSATFSSRFSRIFYIFCILLIPEYLSLFPKNIRKISRGIVICILIALLLYQLSINNYTGYTPDRVSTYWPYRTVFQVI